MRPDGADDFQDLRGRLGALLFPVESPLSPRDGLRPAAVLATIYPHDGRLWIPLIKRSGGGVHGGQLALPGGAWEPGDGSLAETALREAWEEVGLEPASVEIMGRLPDVVVPVSRFVVTPFVGWRSARPELRPHEHEVESVIDLPVDLLLDPTAVRELPAPPGSLNATYFEYDLNGLRLWGATARMLVSLGRILQESREG